MILTPDFKVLALSDAEYLRNSKRYRHFQWNTNRDLLMHYSRVSLRMRLSDLAKYSMTHSIVRSVCDSWASCFHSQDCYTISFNSWYRQTPSFVCSLRLFASMLMLTALAIINILLLLLLLPPSRQRLCEIMENIYNECQTNASSWPRAVFSSLVLCLQGSATAWQCRDIYDQDGSLAQWNRRRSQLVPDRTWQLVSGRQ